MLRNNSTVNISDCSKLKYLLYSKVENFSDKKHIETVIATKLIEKILQNFNKTVVYELLYGGNQYSIALLVYDLEV